ncbi:unnamed protein product [Calicophoron daubneyi]|uniref:G-protein coupled receptors family 1 profile domain-containing protein n=1 Tax=Calicophoron daubneyi TaxID=300641 RepID=A0AAV2T0T7_CALDB
MNSSEILGNSTSEAPSLDWIITLIMLGFVCVVGTVGNLLVLGVYLQHYLHPHVHHQRKQAYRLRGSTSTMESRIEVRIRTPDEESFGEPLTKSTGTPTFFVLVLAGVDLMVCCFVVPLTFYMEYVEMRPGSDFLCKAHSFMAVCNTMFSSLVVISIALDRYLAICHPLHHILTMKKAKILIICNAIFCIIYGVLGSATIKLAETKEDPLVKECTDTVILPNATTAEKYFYHIIQKGNTASFVLAILFVLVLYSMILRVVIQAHRRMRSLNRTALQQTRLSTSSERSSPEPVMEHSTGAHSLDGHLRRYRIRSKRLSRILLRLSIRNLVESKLWREIRTASVLFVVAVVYIIVFTPSLLAANQLACMTLVGYNSYFLNSMADPLIYCFMSKNFRKKLSTLIFGVCLRRKTDDKEQMLTQRKRPPSRINQIKNSANGQIQL